MRYEGRREAGLVLAGELRRLDLGPCIVAGIAPGGMVVAAAVAEHLGAALAALHTRKLFPPQSPELAFGAMDEDGHTILDYRAMVTCGLGESDLEGIKAAAALEMERRPASHPGSRLGDCLPGRTVVLVDDGLVSGFAMQAAIAYVQRHGATATVVAVPCGSDRAVYEVRSLLCRADDRLVCPRIDASFGAVSDYYQAFPPVSDAEVVELLEHAPSSSPAQS